MIVRGIFLAALGATAGLSSALAAQAGVEVKQAAGQSSHYVDRLIDSTVSEAEEALRDEPSTTVGWPRLFGLRLRWGNEAFVTDANLSLGVYGFLDSPNHGSFSWDASTGPRISNGVLTLRQLDFPLDSQWRADHVIGITHTPMLPMSRSLSRVVLPTAILRGAAGKWRLGDDRLQIFASSGRPGYLEGALSQNWRSLPGQRNSLGLQWRPVHETTASASGWTIGARWESARGISHPDMQDAQDRLDADSGVLSARYDSKQYRLSAHGLWSHSPGRVSPRQGIWIDTEWDTASMQHAGGFYRFDNKLHWAGLPMVNGLQGIYVRSSWQGRTLSLQGSVDWLDPLASNARRGFYANSSGRYRLDSRNQFSGGLALRDYGGRGSSLYLDWRYQHANTNQGLRLDFASMQGRPSERRLTYDRSWPVPSGWMLNTSIVLGHLGPSEQQRAQSLWGVSANVSAPLTSQIKFTGVIDWERRGAGERRYAVNFGATWDLSRDWNLRAQYIHNQGRSRTFFLDPLVQVASSQTSTQRAFFAILRYERQAGAPLIPLGGQYKQGGGRLSGVVFFDGNRSGTQEAHEQGVSDVTVVLNDRYTAKTDAQGRFEFPFVAAGQHTLTLLNETLPLPWQAVGGSRLNVTVELRGSSEVKLPVQKLD